MRNTQGFPPDPEYRLMVIFLSLLKRRATKKDTSEKPKCLVKVEIDGVEPTTLCLQSRCSSQLSYIPKIW